MQNRIVSTLVLLFLGFLVSCSRDHPTEPIKVTAELLWTYPAFVIQSTPAITNAGTIYIAADYWGPDSLIALNQNGQKQWTCSIGYSIDWTATSSPAVSNDGTVYIGGANGHLYSISPTGSVNWEYETDRHISESPAIGNDGAIYFSSHDYYFYCVNTDGSLRWRQFISTSASSAAIGSDGTVYIGSLMKALIALNNSGDILWEAPTDYNIVGCSPAIGPDGTVYIASYKGTFYAIDPSGIQLWSFEAGPLIDTPPVMNEAGQILIISDNLAEGSAYSHYLGMLNPNGDLKWRYDSNSLAHPPIIGQKGIIFVSIDSTMYALSPEGSVIWAFLTGDTISSAPALGPDGVLYFGSFDGNLYAIQTDCIGLANSSWPKHRSDYRNTGRVRH